MTKERVHDIIENELRCVQIRSNYCDRDCRDCAKCPLVKDDKELIEAYGYVIKALEQEPCEDAISHDDRLIDLANAIESDDSGYWTNKRISSALRNISSVTQKSGHWIEEIDDYGKVIHWHCDKCYEDSGFITDCKWDFCPNCGARMIESEE